ncbi:MAG: biotin--[acetyl-CoA-carboxylase] ligase [Dissulfuribacterales bacterium]
MKSRAEFIHCENKKGIIGRERIHLAKTDSTNTWLLKRPHLLKIEGLVVYADEQTAGRGSKGRSWLSLSGEQLFCSVALHPRLMPSQLPSLTLFVGVAVAQGLTRLGVKDIGLKWPNDILLNHKKIGGILCEAAQPGGQERPWVVVGIGLNLQGQPEATILHTATSLKEAGYSISRNTVLNAILWTLNGIYSQIQKQNLSHLMELWRAHSHTLGKNVKIVGGETEIMGKALNISEHGALLIETADGVVEVNHGSLFYL